MNHCCCYCFDVASGWMVMLADCWFCWQSVTDRYCIFYRLLLFYYGCHCLVATGVFVCCYCLLACLLACLFACCLFTHSLVLLCLRKFSKILLPWLTQIPAWSVADHAAAFILIIAFVCDSWVFIDVVADNLFSKNWLVFVLPTHLLWLLPLGLYQPPGTRKVSGWCPPNHTSLYLALCDWIGGSVVAAATAAAHDDTIKWW